MKAILILIVTAGTVQGASLGPDQTVQIREIEFSSMATCRRAAQQMVKSAHRADDRARIFSIDEATGRMLVPAPVIIAECVET
jgi:hypothetical protein